MGLIGDLHEILAILVLEHRLGEFTELVGCDPTVAVGYAFQTGYLQSLTLLEYLHIYRSLRERVVRARIKPCKPTRESTYL